LNIFFVAGNCGSCTDEERKVIFFTYEDDGEGNDFWGNIGNTIIIILTLWGWLPWAILANLFWEDFTFYQE